MVFKKADSIKTILKPFLNLGVWKSLVLGVFYYIVKRPSLDNDNYDLKS